MLNRTAVAIGHEPAFYGWLRTTGVAADAIAGRREIGDRRVYLIPACANADEAEEVIADLFEEIFRRELGVWQPDTGVWPDTADFDLFARWFTVEPFIIVEDVGRGAVTEEA